MRVVSPCPELLLLDRVRRYLHLPDIENDHRTGKRDYRVVTTAVQQARGDPTGVYVYTGELTVGNTTSASQRRTVRGRYGDSGSALWTVCLNSLASSPSSEANTSTQVTMGSMWRAAAF